jgi:hypothetical protein
MPVYFTTLNLAMGLNLLEIFKGKPIVNIATLFVLYTGWMLHTIFCLGKKNLKKKTSGCN